MIAIFEDTSAFAEHLGRTDPRTTVSEDIGTENRAGGSLDIVARDLLDKTRDVDARGTGHDTGRVVAIEATVCFGEGLLPGKSGFDFPHRFPRFLLRKDWFQSGHGTILLCLKY